jgi:hypothetical protein
MSDSSEPIAAEGISGRVAFDDRGNAVWEFQTDDGAYAREADTALVRKLEAPTLALEQTAIVKRVEEPAPSPQQHPGDGFNPYDSVAHPATARSALKLPPVHPVVAPKRRSGGLLQRLWSWHQGRGR